MLLALASSAALSGEEAPKEETVIVTTLLDATKENDLEKFESVCDDNMRKAATEESLTQASKQVSALMKDGYEKTYMGVLDRAQFKTYYWKLDFKKEGTPDMLVELSVKDGEAVGFFIR